MSMVDSTSDASGTVTDGNLEGAAPEGSSDSIRTITIEVNGIEVDLTEDELKQGYMRQADYTRKTQTLAEQRKEAEQALNILNALRAKPQETLSMLAQELGVEDIAPSYEDDDPIAKRLQDFEAEVATLREREVQREIQREIDTLQSKYGVTNDQITDIMQHATKRGIDLQAAYRDLFFDDAFEALRKARERKAVETEILEVKTGPAAAVHLGTGASTTAGSGTPKVERPRSFREAYALAKQGLKYDGD